jgi:hypothetical protein
VKLGDDEDGGIRGDIDINQWRNGRVTIIALQRERPESAEGEASNQATDPRGNIAIRLSHPAYLYDLRQARFLAYGDHVVVPLDPIRPAILAASPERRPLPRISGTQHVRRGGTIRLRVATAPNELASRPLFHIEVTDPSGRALSAVGENLAMSRGKCVWVHPVASDAQAGTWQIRITDTLGGGTTTWPVEVR